MGCTIMHITQMCQHHPAQNGSWAFGVKLTEPLMIAIHIKLILCNIIWSQTFLL